MAKKKAHKPKNRAGGNGPKKSDKKKRKGGS